MKVKRRMLGGALALAFAMSMARGGEKPPITLNEFFDYVSISSVQASPDGHAVVMETERADWDANRFRNDLWLYRDAGAGSLIALTQSRHDSAPRWSPDGQWIAFLSDRSTANVEAKAEVDDAPAKGASAQVWVISASGGEAFLLTHGDEEVHAFAWAGDSKSIFFATRLPLTKEQEEAHKKDWKDVVRFRESERGDVIRRAAMGDGEKPIGDEAPPMASTADRVSSLAVSPDGKHLAILTEPRSQRQESIEPYAIYAVDLPGGIPRIVGRTQAVTDRISWARDSRHIFFSYQNGNAEGPYQDVQQRVYWVDALASQPNQQARWAAKFNGSVADYAVLADGSLLASGRLGTEVQPYTQNTPDEDFAKRNGWAGTYENLSAAAHSGRIAFVYSSLESPAEVYLAEGPDGMKTARAITSFNRLFTERALPQGKPYQWKTDDGETAEGMLVYPPGKLGAKNLPMLTLIHGGPADADGNHFEADWYQWAGLAATQGWLVFEPNYRGSVGYGDAWTMGIIPHIVSRPGKDILEGVDQLVKDGTADSSRLTVGGYSYGGYMTNWLITQTTEFKAAVTGAGSVEHVADWGNDDTTMDDAFFLGGLPWEAEANYNAEAAIWQFGKVTTPTHVVAGAEDIRVYVGEDYLLERALHTRGIPSSLLIFPGEGHSLDKNPWHGKIKVREELKWLEKYAAPKPAP